MLLLLLLLVVVVLLLFLNARGISRPSASATPLLGAMDAHRSCLLPNPLPQAEVKRPPLFAHLGIIPSARIHELLARDAPADVHPAFLDLARMFGERTVSGGSARVVALLRAIRQVVIDHTSGGSRGDKTLLAK